MAIKTIFLDMDGVLVDFTNAAVEANCLDLKNRKVDWNILNALGPKFWEDLEWLNEGKKLYEFLVEFCKEHDIDLCILSAVGRTSGKEGKKLWLKKWNVKINPMNVYIVNRGTDKAKFADPESLLIDDYSKNINEFIQAGGEGVKFKNNAQETIDKIKEIFSKE